MTKDQLDSYAEGLRQGAERMNRAYASTATYLMAQEVRVLICSLNAAHNVRDEMAFMSAIEVAKLTLSKYANFNDEDWSLFQPHKPL